MPEAGVGARPGGAGVMPGKVSRGTWGGMAGPPGRGGEKEGRGGTAEVG